MINELLGIKYPIFQGAMANIATAEFASAVSNAGGLGIIGTGAMDKETARREIEKCRKLTDKIFGVNIMLMNPHVKDIVDLVCEEKVKVVTTGAGNPGQYIDRFKECGIVVIPVISTVAMAKRLSRYDIDAIIAEGTEAGGHIGDTTTMCLVPQIVDEVNVPVISAGGIADKRGFNAAIALGASGVQLGTRLLVSKECPIHENYKNVILRAKDTETVVTGRTLGAPVRILKNKMSRKYLELEKEITNRDEMEKLTLGSLKRAVYDGDIDYGSLMAGQIAGLCKEVKSLEEIFKEICE